MWTPTPKEVEAVFQLPGPKRYEYCVKRLADSRRVWGLEHPEGGWACAGDGNGDLLPIWPHPLYAQPYRDLQFPEFKPRRILLRSWMEKWLPDLEQEGTRIAVLPTPEGRSPVVTALRLLEDLREELAQYQW